MTENRTRFKPVPYEVSQLLHNIEIGDLALPDIQRRFVWKTSQVRDLLDSMYKGFPVGYLLLWENSSALIDRFKQIGNVQKDHTPPKLLIIDGQQRLTSLYAVLRGKKVLDNEYQEKEIQIAFCPRNGKFEVPDAAIARDPEYLSNITTHFIASNTERLKLQSAFIANLKEKKGLEEIEEDTILENFARLLDLQKYPFTAIELAHDIDHESIADIFVRINSEGVDLKQPDFILTLLSVFAEDLRKLLDDFCRDAKQPPSTGQPSSYNHFFEPSPDQLIRVVAAVGFNRARISSVYQILRGRDPESEQFSETFRGQQLDIFRKSQLQVLDLTNWHSFLNTLTAAGYRSKEMLTSSQTVLYAYSLFLIGKNQAHVGHRELDRIIARWFFMTSITRRYVGSPETVMEQDLNRVKDLVGSAFVDELQRLIVLQLTNDFWAVSLPNALDSSSARSPALFAYQAAQVKLDAPALFSNKKIAAVLDPIIRSKKKALEKHHLFPKSYLQKAGIKDKKLINQIANFAFVEWADNIDVLDDPPSEYVSRYSEKFDQTLYETMCDFHALPKGWEQLSYPDFLAQRRILMADVIKRGFEKLAIE